jgi:hypothetical protein
MKAIKRLLEEVKEKPASAFTEENRRALAALRVIYPHEFEETRRMLRNAGVRVGELDGVIKDEYLAFKAEYDTAKADMERDARELAEFYARVAEDIPVDQILDGWPFGGNPAEMLEAMNTKFAVIKNRGGKACILRHTTNEKLEPIDAFCDVHSFHNIIASNIPSIKGDEKPAKATNWWLAHSKRREYEGVVFDPSTTALEINKHLNQWRGFGVQPSSDGDWGLMRIHIRDVLANSDEQNAKYIVKWLAWAVQNPDKPAEVALVLRGDEGVGKGTLVNTIIKLFGKHGLAISDSNLLTGTFTGHFETCCFIFADEGFFAGDHKARDKLYAMITEPTIMIHDKFCKAFPARNRTKMIFASNSGWVVPAGPNSRRWAVFDVSDKRRGDLTYFKPLDEQMKNGGYERMLHDLQRVDLKGWHPRDDVPHTLALQDQRDRSLRSEARWLLTILENGVLPHTTYQANLTNNQVYNCDLYRSLNDSAGPRAKEYFNQMTLKPLLENLGCRQKHTTKGKLWTFPPIKEMRENWCKKYGMRVWEETDAEWPEQQPLFQT